MAFKLIPQKSEPSSLKKDIKETVSRAPAQLGALGGSILAGVPGEMAKFGYNIGSLVGGDKGAYETSEISKYLPTIGQHLSTFEKSFPSLKPKNKVESFYRDTLKDAAELYLPGKWLGAAKYAMTPLRSLGISLAANAGADITKDLSGDQKKAEMVKQGTMLGLSLFNPRQAKDIYSDLYTRASKALPKNAVANTQKLNQELDILEKSVRKGKSSNQLSPSESFVVDEINKIRQTSAGGIAEVETLESLKKGLNENLTKFVFSTPDRAAKAGVRKLAASLNGHLKDTLKDYGKTNPEWWKNYSEAEKAYGAIQKSNFISRFLDKHLQGRPEWLSHAFGIAAPTGISLLSPLGGALAPLAYQGAKIVTRILNSKSLAKHYSKVVGSAAAGNVHELNKNLDELEEEWDKEKKGKYKLVSKKR